MGNLVNKYFSHNYNDAHGDETEKVEVNNLSLKDEITHQNNDMQTPPTVNKTMPADPRSVTSGINRTPIEVYNTPVGLGRKAISAIPRHLQRKPYLETDIDQVMLCLTPKKHMVSTVVEPATLQTLDVATHNAEMLLTPIANAACKEKIISAIDKERYNVLGLDPRSPAANFDRTPILMPKSLASLKARSHEQLQRHGSYDTDVYYPRFSYCEMSSQFNIAEIQALPDFAASAIKSLDLDDLDHKDKSNESYSSYSSNTESFSENSNETTIIKNLKSLETTVRDNLSSIDEKSSALIENELGNLDEISEITNEDNYDDVFVTKSKEQKEASDNDADTIKIWRDSLVLDELVEKERSDSDNIEVIKKRVPREPKEQVIITFDDDSITKDTLSLKLFKCETEITRFDAVGKKKKILKLQDEKKVFNIDDKNGSENTKIRTPLGNRSNNGQVQAISTNSPQQAFRSKGITSKMLQENTPPHKKYVTKSKLNGTQWDPDSTVLI